MKNHTPVNIHPQYHAHLYFDQHTITFATQLYQKIADQFDLTMGRIHQKPVGPHTMWSAQIVFTQHDFAQFVPWLEQHRGELSILIHADTGDDLRDHTDYVYWLGDAVALDLSLFKKHLTD